MVNDNKTQGQSSHEKEVLIHLDYIKRDIGMVVAAIKEMESKYVSQIEFKPFRQEVEKVISNMVTKEDIALIKKLVYGFTAIFIVVGLSYFFNERKDAEQLEFKIESAIKKSALNL